MLNNLIISTQKWEYIGKTIMNILITDYCPRFLSNNLVFYSNFIIAIIKYL